MTLDPFTTPVNDLKRVFYCFLLTNRGPPLCRICIPRLLIIIKKIDKDFKSGIITIRWWMDNGRISFMWALCGRINQPYYTNGRGTLLRIWECRNFLRAEDGKWPDSWANSQVPNRPREFKPTVNCVGVRRQKRAIFNSRCWGKFLRNFCHLRK